MESKTTTARNVDGALEDAAEGKTPRSRILTPVALLAVLLVGVGGVKLASTDQPAEAKEAAALASSDRQPTGPATGKEEEGLSAQMNPPQHFTSGEVNWRPQVVAPVDPARFQDDTNWKMVGHPSINFDAEGNPLIGWVEIVETLDKESGIALPKPVFGSDGKQVGWWGYTLGWVDFETFYDESFDYASSYLKNLKISYKPE